MADEHLREQAGASEEIFQGKILHLFRDQVLLPDGRPATREVVRHVGAVCVLPLTEDGLAVMERQYRYPVNQVLLEIPAGKLDSREEDPLAAAQRELEEETGYRASTWIPLGKFYPACAYSDEGIWMYLAKGLERQERHLDPGEFLDVVHLPLEELVEQALGGQIPDAKTQLAILKAAVHEGVLERKMQHGEEYGLK